MRHVIVTRVSLGLAVLFLVSGGLFALVVTSRRQVVPADSPAGAGGGAAAFTDRCGSCHDAADLAPAVRHDRARIDAFLRTHGGAAPEERRPILDYVASR